MSVGLVTQNNLKIINNWTKKKKMMLNLKKTKNMIINFTRKYPFTTRLKIDDENIEVVKEIKLLGTIVTNDLKWDKNTKLLTKKGNMRMQLLHKAANFTNESRDLKSIYLTFIRPALEQSAVVWHSSLSEENSTD